MDTYSEIITSLSNSDVLSVIYKTLVEVMGKDRDSKFIPGKHLAIEKKYSHYSQNNPHRQSPLRWTDCRSGRANIFLTADALVVLKLGGS